MKNTTFQNANNKPAANDELLKITALLYFKEALVDQEYEQCPALIANAKRYGARRADIKQVIEEVRKGKADRQLEQDVALGGRLKLAEEE